MFYYVAVDNVPSGRVGSAPPACPAVVPAAGAPASVHVVRAGVDHARPVPAADAAVPAADLVAGPPEAFPECVPVLAEVDDEVSSEFHGIFIPDIGQVTKFYCFHSSLNEVIYMLP